MNNKPTLIKIVPHEARTVSWWFSRKESINFDPQYQRKGGIWSAKDRAYLIDTILNGFDMPKLYLADFTYTDSDLKDGQWDYAVIDGKQRFEALFDFYSDGLALDSDFVYRAEPSFKAGGLKFSELESRYPKVATIFENYNLGVMSVITSDQALIGELFDRLNSSRPLSGAEKRNAWKTPQIEVVREIASHKFFTSCVSFSTLRMQDHNLAAKLLTLEWSHFKGDSKKATIDKFVSDRGIDAKVLGHAQTAVEHNLATMTAIFSPVDKLLSKSGVLPTYYLFIKHCSIDILHHVKPFLKEFEKLRAANRAEAKAQRHADQTLLLYDRLSRSGDDSSTIIECAKILQQYFTNHINGNL